MIGLMGNGEEYQGYPTGVIFEAVNMEKSDLNGSVLCTAVDRLQFNKVTRTVIEATER